VQGNATLARLQRLAAKDSLYVSASWQRANGNLYPSQKMIAGGPYTVRSYDMSALSGDGGIQASAEWRRDLPAWHGQWQALGFVNTEHLTINEKPWTNGTNTATISGTGLGVNWTGPTQVECESFGRQAHWTGTGSRRRHQLGECVACHRQGILIGEYNYDQTNVCRRYRPATRGLDAAVPDARAASGD
jgi:hemolysin activation/secretion protein